MDKQQVLEKIKFVRELSPKRNFNQSFDLSITLKSLNLKKPGENVDVFAALPYPRGKQPRICALVGRELSDQSKIFDGVVTLEEFPAYQDKKAAKKLASQYDFFIAQANLMAQIATTFGKVFGPRNKMPNPKAGAVVSPGSDLQQVKSKLSKQARLQTKKELIVKASIAQESMSDEHVAENFLVAYNALIHALPQEESNIKEVFLKLTMGPSISFSLTSEQLQEKLKQKTELEKQAPKPKKQARIAKPPAQDKQHEA
ncbi:MAG TPA: hypothetical protein VJH95_04525 [Candidatus Nanoarchaeia archaeon]|nr:hypothetical protein [Candidatus Nanoarchaeia archaeon]